MEATIKSVLAEARDALERTGVNEPHGEAGLLLMHLLKCDRAFLIAHSDQQLRGAQLEEYRRLVTRRAAGWPLQYITGRQEFYRLDFEVTPAVLIPRPETELIVEASLPLLQGTAAPVVADIGTGSGCLAISLLQELPRARAVAVDTSPAALSVAQRNAERHKVTTRLRLVKSDLFSAIDSGARFDVIVSNPPYIPAGDLGSLQREVLHEPRGALDGGPDGLTIIRRLVTEAPGFLNQGGHLIFEIGLGQASSIRDLVNDDVWELVELRRDLQGIQRIVVLRKRV